jgi:hypothetical protein
VSSSEKGSKDTKDVKADNAAQEPRQRENERNDQPHPGYTSDRENSSGQYMPDGGFWPPYEYSPEGTPLLRPTEFATKEETRAWHEKQGVLSKKATSGDGMDLRSADQRRAAGDLRPDSEDDGSDAERKSRSASGDSRADDKSKDDDSSRRAGR